MRFSLHGPILGSVLLSVMGFAVPTKLQAQAERLDSLARARQLRWLQAAPVVHCGPAPLAERPTASAEFARGGGAPLESAFLDAMLVRRTLSLRVRSRPNPTE